MSSNQPDQTNNPSAESTSTDLNQNPGARSADVNQHPERSLEEGRNAAAGEGTNAAGSVAPSSVEEHVPSNSDPSASDLPSAR
jgi:hypothetical protein